MCLTAKIVTQTGNWHSSKIAFPASLPFWKGRQSQPLYVVWIKDGYRFIKM